MIWSVTGEPRLRLVGSYAGQVQPSLQNLVITEDRATAAIACGDGLEVIDLRAGERSFFTAKGKKLGAGLTSSEDGGVLAGFANLSEKAKRLVLYRRGPRGYRGERLPHGFAWGPSTDSRETNLGLTPDGARAVTVDRGDEAVVIDTSTGEVAARLPLGELSRRGGPTPSGNWRLARDGRLWTVHPDGEGSELACRDLLSGEVLLRRRFPELVVIEDESPAGHLALLAPRSGWAQKEPLADAIVIDREGREVHRVAALDGALRFEGEDRLLSIPPHRYLSIFRPMPSAGKRIDLRSGDVLSMPGEAAVARVTPTDQAAEVIVGDALLVSDGRSLWEMEADGRVRATHTCEDVAEPTRRVHLVASGDRVLLVADRDGAIRSGASEGPNTVVTVFGC